MSLENDMISNAAFDVIQGQMPVDMLLEQN
jgi:hypothetical protein